MLNDFLIRIDSSWLKLFSSEWGTFSSKWGNGF